MSSIMMTLSNTNLRWRSRSVLEVSSIDESSLINNNIIKDTDISVMNDGYSLIQGPGVSPFDVKTENTFDSKFVFENGISA